ncbi:hypothetical protein ABEH01_08350 [Pantoea agglomerans]|uniref:hypothetical protein n=1 Tax=Enterobacter agglomerans TaxID=549 RepID=UPI00320A02D8
MTFRFLIFLLRSGKRQAASGKRQAASGKRQAASGKRQVDVAHSLNKLPKDINNGILNQSSKVIQNRNYYL